MKHNNRKENFLKAVNLHRAVRKIVLPDVFEATEIVYEKVRLPGDVAGDAQKLSSYPDEPLVDDYRDSQGAASFTIQVHARFNEKLYKSEADFFADSAVVAGNPPECFFIDDIDCCSIEPVSYSSKVRAYYDLIELKSYLERLSDYVGSDDKQKLVFFHPDHQAQKQPTVLWVRITEELLRDIKPLDLKIVRSLVNEDAHTNPHYHAEMGVFETTISEFAEKSGPDIFGNLVKDWPKFIELYQNNLKTYLSGFGFHKAKKEVAEAQLELAEKFSKVLGDISGKLLALPISLALVRLTTAVDNPFQKFAYGAALVLTSAFLFIIVKNQKHYFTRVKHSKEITINSFEGDKGNFPQELQDFLEQMKDSLDKEGKRLGNMLKILEWVVWFPALVAFIVYAPVLTFISDNFCWIR